MRAAIAVIFALSTTIASSQSTATSPSGDPTGLPVTLELESGWAWAGPSWGRCAVTVSGLRIIVACQDFSTWENGVAFGLGAPWICVGPLSPAGLFREASNPMGYSAGSEVFRERTCLRLDSTFPLSARGLVWMPVREAFGLFVTEGRGDAPVLGSFASLMAGPGLGVEVVVLLEKPPAPTVGDVGDAWLLCSAPWPGGTLLRTALRFMADHPGISVTAALGSTLAERAPPGMFWHVGCDASGAVVSGSVLLAGATRSYLLPDGSAPALEAKAECRLGFDAPGRSFRLRLSTSVDPPGFVPRRFLAGQGSAGISFEQSAALPGSLRVRISADAEKNVARSAYGEQAEAARCAVALEAAADEFVAQAEIEADAADGLALGASFEHGRAERPCRAVLSARLEGILAARPALSVLGEVRIRQRETAWTVEAGVEHADLGSGAAGLAAGFRFALTWNVRSAALTIARPTPPPAAGRNPAGCAPAVPPAR
jgi:hypothetical protein